MPQSVSERVPRRCDRGGTSGRGAGVSGGQGLRDLRVLSTPVTGPGRYRGRLTPPGVSGGSYCWEDLEHGKTE